jgi:hypothetical protein
MTENLGASCGPGSREPDPQAVPAASGFDPSRAHYATIVVAGPSADAVSAIITPIMEDAPFCLDEGRVRTVAVSLRADAMSVLDAVRAAVETRALDSSEMRDLAKEISYLDTWEECLDVFASWDLEYVDGELIDLRDSDRSGEADETAKQAQP